MRESLRGRPGGPSPDRTGGAASEDAGRPGAMAAPACPGSSLTRGGAGLSLHLTAGQLAQLQSAASKEGLSIAAWAA